MMDYIFEAREGWCGTGWRMLYIPRCCGIERRMRHGGCIDISYGVDDVSEMGIHQLRLLTRTQSEQP